jgi:hypothetical protein
MALILPVTLNGCLALSGLPPGTNAQLSALIALEQPAWEFAIDPVLLANTLTNPGLQAILTLGVSEAIAGDYVISLWRQPQLSTTFKVSTLSIETHSLNDLSKIGTALLAQGTARLQPFLQASKNIARTAFAGDGNYDDSAPVDLSIGAGIGIAPPIGVIGPPQDTTFDRQLGVDGHTDPPSADIFGFYGGPNFGGSDF